MIITSNNSILILCNYKLKELIGDNLYTLINKCIVKILAKILYLDIIINNLLLMPRWWNW